MKKTIVSIMLVCCSIVSMGQGTLHDYVTITVYGQWNIAISTDSGLRTETIQVEKGEEPVQIRLIVATNKRILALVQEYEAKGWTLFSVYDDRLSGATWIMRKPKK